MSNALSTLMLRIAPLALLAGLLSSCGPNVAKADAYEQMADSMMSAGAYPAAMDAMERSIKYDSNEPRRWIKLGRAQRAADQPALAAMAFQRALDLDPANIEGLENMAILLVRAGRYDEARGYVDPLMALQPDDIAGLLTLGAMAMFRQQYTEANNYADRLIKIAPSSIGGYTLKAHVLNAQGHPKEAGDLLEKQVTLNPNDPDLALQLLQLFQSAHDIEGIRSTSLILANIFPDDPRYLMEKVRTLHARDKEGEATELLAKIQQRFRGNADVMRAVADFWLGSMPRDQAVTKITDLTAKLGGTPKAELADLLIDLGQGATAVRLLEPDVRGEVSVASTDLHATYARALQALGRSDQAEKEAERVLMFDGSTTVALVVRAQIRLATKQYDKALNDAQIALANDHFNAEAAILIPQIFSAMGKKVLAEQAWGTAQARLPHNADINRLRTNWLAKEGRVDDAVQIASTFAQGSPNDPAVWRHFRDLCQQARDQCFERADARVRQLS